MLEWLMRVSQDDRPTAWRGMVTGYHISAHESIRTSRSFRKDTLHHWLLVPARRPFSE